MSHNWWIESMMMLDGWIMDDLNVGINDSCSERLE